MLSVLSWLSPSELATQEHRGQVLGALGVQELVLRTSTAEQGLMHPLAQP